MLNSTRLPLVNPAEVSNTRWLLGVALKRAASPHSSLSDTTAPRGFVGFLLLLDGKVDTLAEAAAAVGVSVSSVHAAKVLVEVGDRRLVRDVLIGCRGLQSAAREVRVQYKLLMAFGEARSPADLRNMITGSEALRNKFFNRSVVSAAVSVAAE